MKKKKKKTVNCKCRSGCKNRRCACLLNNEPCDDGCECDPCRNPLNGLDVVTFSVCALQNIVRYKALSKKDLEK